MKTVNILILAAGTRNKIIQYFKNAFSGSGKVIATDSSIYAPAIYEADKYFIVPNINEDGYIEVILDICKKEKINGVLSLIDPELSLLAKNKDEFNKIGTTVIGSSYEMCQTTFNKYDMYLWLESHNYRCARSWLDKDAFYKDVQSGNAKFPVFIKPVCGSASLGIQLVKDQQTLDFLMMSAEGLMIQEYLDGQEFGADVYIDMISGETASIFVKKKLKMRAGETDKAVSFKDPKLFELIEKFCREAGYLGQIDIDLFNVNGEYYISEVNPRFGGGYPHAYECGCNHMSMILNNLQGNINPVSIGTYEEKMVMMKYNEVCIRKI